jgi:hypothetical protein
MWFSMNNSISISYQNYDAREWEGGFLQIRWWYFFHDNSLHSKKSELDSKIPSNLSRREGYACSQSGALLVRTSNLLTVDFEFSTNLTVRLT